MKEHKRLAKKKEWEISCLLDTYHVPESILGTLYSILLNL